MVAGSSPEHLRYIEPSFTAYANQILSEECSVGMSYRYTHSDLDEVYIGVPEPSPSTPPEEAFYPTTQQTADYHQLGLHGRWNHPSGFFTAAEALWRHQDYRSSVQPSHNESFWQFNLFAGYRMKRQRAEITLGVLNLFDQDYRLHPLSPYLDLPRERSFFCQAKFRL